MTLVEMTSADKHPIRSIGESPEDKRHINTARAHHANQFNIRSVLLSGNSSQIGSAVRSPIANETEDFRLEFYPRTHCFLTSFQNVQQAYEAGIAASI
jgi:hypothetical protein